MNPGLVALFAAAGVLGAVMVAGFVLSRTVVRGNAEKARVVLGPARPGDHEESAAMLAPDTSYGVLRLTGDRLRYADGTGGRIITIERAEITGAVETAEDKSATGGLRRSALAITAASGTWVFAVGDVDRWVRRLN